MALTNTTAHAILGDTFTGKTLYVGLHITDPTNAGLADTELTTAIASTYARKPVTFTAPANRAVSNNNELLWLALPVVSIGYLGVWSAPAGGTLMAVFGTTAGALDILVAGGSIRLPIHSIAITIGGSANGDAGGGGLDPI